MGLVGSLSALAHQGVTHAMQNRQRLLRLGFGDDKTHGWPACGLADGLGIHEVILVALHERPDKLR
ncbi:hypothetical protein D3C80_1885740 [compost metagenome]